MHAGERPGSTRPRLIAYCERLRQVIRATADGTPLPQPGLNADGEIPTMADDVLVVVPETDDDTALQREVLTELRKLRHKK